MRILTHIRSKLYITKKGVTSSLECGFARINQNFEILKDAPITQLRFNGF